LAVHRGGTIRRLWKTRRRTNGSTTMIAPCRSLKTPPLLLARWHIVYFTESHH